MHGDEYKPNQAEPLNTWFVSAARFILKHRWPVLLVTLMATAFLTHQIATRLKVDNSIEAFTASAGEASQTLEELRQYFGKDDVFLVVVEGNVFSEGYVQKLKAFTDDLSVLNPPLDRDPVYEQATAVKQRSGTEPPPVQTGRVGVEEGANDQDSSWDELDDDFEDVEFDTDGASSDPSADSAPGEQDISGAATELYATVFEEIASLINVRRARPTHDGGVSFPKLMDPLPNQEQLNALRSEVLEDRFLVGSLVNRKGTMSVVTLRTPAMQQTNTEIIYKAVRDVANKHQADDFKIYVSGVPALTVELNRLMLEDLGRMLAIATLGMILVLFLIFRHPIGVFGPLVVVSLSCLWTFGMMAALGVTMTLLSSILPAFITCVGVGDSIHLLSVYRDRRAGGASNHDSIIFALGSVGMPIVYTSLTTMMGLLSFQMSSLDAIGEMGASGAFGVFIAMVLSLLILPVSLSFNKRSKLGLRERKDPSQRDRVDIVLDWFSTLSKPSGGSYPARRRVLNLASAVMVLAASIWGMSQLTVSHDPISWVPEDSEVVQGFDLVEEHFGGLSNVELLIEPHSEQGMRSPELLYALDRVNDDVRGYVHTDGTNIVGTSFSLLELLKETHRASRGLDASFDRLPKEIPCPSDCADSENRDRPDCLIPDCRGIMQDLLFQVETGPKDALRRIATTGLDRARITYRVGWLDATSYEPLTKHIDQSITKHVGDLAEVKKSGGLFTVFSIVGTLIHDLVRSFLFAFIVIAVLMIIFLRSLKLGLIAMVPNLLPIAVIMGLMGFGGIPIDMNNLLIASIAMGLAVDDTIHFLHHYKTHYAATGNVEHSVFHAIRYCGRAIMVTSIILSIGFYAYLGASMTNIQRFGMLVGSTVVIALVIDLVYCPALLRTFFRDKPVERPGGQP